MQATEMNMANAADRIAEVFERARRRVFWRWGPWPSYRTAALDAIEKARVAMQTEQRLARFVKKLPEGVYLQDATMTNWEEVVLAILGVLSFIPVIGLVFAVLALVLSIIWSLTGGQVNVALISGQIP